MKPRLIVIGIDGAPYSLTRSLIDSGALPVLQRLSQEGQFGCLESSLPPHTAPGWSSIFTGVPPGDHGIYQFWQLQGRDYRPMITSSSDFKWQPVWRTLADSGWRVGVLNVPMTHPPIDLPGWMIAWPLAPSLNYARPHEVLHELAEAGLHYQSDLISMWAGAAEYPGEALQQIDSRGDVLCHLMETRPTDALFFVVTEFDRIAHYHWQADGPEPVVVEALQAIDAMIGRVLEHVDDEASVVIASDHGFGPCSGDIQINRVLEDAGLLTRTAQHSDNIGEQTHAEFFAGDGEAVGAAWFRDGQGDLVDWEKTWAFMPAPGCYGINLNLEGRQRLGRVREVDRAAIEDDIDTALSEIRDGDGAPIFKRVPREVVYSGPCIEDAPDYLLLPRSWSWMAHPGLAGPIHSPPSQLGVHSADGIVLVRAKETTAPIEHDARVEDVGATILALAGQPLSENLAGSPLAGITEAGARVADRRITPTDEGVADARLFAAAERRLADLGYL